MTFDEYEKEWHSKFKEDNPNWASFEMYLNGQFDEMPYIEWDKLTLVKEL